ncbi:MAG: SsrA-binding protein SmpB [Parcubacteria group bacterium]|nr:SsrA-binding protein SmpB [Parcubacteria group bacterium]
MLYADNRRASFDYEILEKFQVGIVLEGHEVKSIRLGRINVAGSYAKIIGNELWLVGATISPYQPQNTASNYDPQRTRKLLVKKSELRYLIGKLQEKGLTLVPLSVYNKNSLIKLELGLGKSKKKSDKREKIKTRETERKIERTLKQY